MHPSNQELDGAQHRPGPNSQSIFEHPVIEILDPDAGQAMENVDRFKDVAQVDHPDLPTAMLLVGQRLKRGGGGSMASAGVEEDQIDLRLAPAAAGRKARARFMTAPPQAPRARTRRDGSARDPIAAARALRCDLSATAVQLLTQSPSLMYQMGPIRRCSGR